MFRQHVTMKQLVVDMGLFIIVRDGSDWSLMHLMRIDFRCVIERHQSIRTHCTSDSAAVVGHYELVL